MHGFCAGRPVCTQGYVYFVVLYAVNCECTLASGQTKSATRSYGGKLIRSQVLFSWEEENKTGLGTAWETVMTALRQKYYSGHYRVVEERRWSKNTSRREPETERWTVGLKYSWRELSNGSSSRRQSYMERSDLWPMFHWQRQDIRQVSHAVTCVVCRIFSSKSLIVRPSSLCHTTHFSVFFGISDIDCIKFVFWWCFFIIARVVQHVAAGVISRAAAASHH